MAKKPFPFKVCEQCCTTGGGTGGDFTETDPTVPDWAKQPSKPMYTAGEVGALGVEAANSESDTVIISYGYKKVTDTYDIGNAKPIVIPVEDNTTKYSIEFSVDPEDNIPVGVSGKNGEWADLPYANPTVIELDKYGFEIVEIHVLSVPVNKILVTKYYDEKVINADVKMEAIESAVNNAIGVVLGGES